MSREAQPLLSAKDLAVNLKGKNKSEVRSEVSLSEMQKILAS